MQALGDIVGAMFTGEFAFLHPVTEQTVVGLVIVATTILIHYVFRLHGFVGTLEAIPKPLRVVLYGIIFFLLLISDQPNVGFIYFQF